MVAPGGGRADLGAINAALLSRVDELMDRLGITSRRMRGGREWEGGEKGARITVTLTGTAAGTWGAWSQNAKGWGLVSLIAWARGIGFGPAIGEARAFLGGDLAPAVFVARASITAKPKDDSARIKRARRIAQRFRPIAGTVAERYLVEHRRIPVPAEGWPSSLGFDAVDRALGARVLDQAGAVVAVHRVFLTPDGCKLDTAELERRSLRAVKQTDGPRSAGTLLLGSLDDGRLMVAEGLETGLAIQAVTGRPVLVALGSLTGLKTLPPDATVVTFALEDDAADSPAAIGAGATVQRFADTGIDVSIAWPWAERRGDKSDLADTLHLAGSEAIRARIAATERVRSALHPGASLAEVREIMAVGVSAWLDGAGPRHLLLPGEPGTGKSFVAHALPIVDMARRKAAGEPHRLALFVPDHALAGETLERITAQAAEAGLTAAVLLGFGDPDKPLTAASPCQNLVAVKLALSAGQSPTTAVCGPNAGGDRCAHFKGCPRLASLAAAKTADLVIMPTAYAFEAGRLPSAVRAGLQRAIVDEDLLAPAISTSALGLETFAPLPLDRAPVLRDGQRDDDATAELQRLHGRLVAAAGASPDGYLAAQTVQDAGLGLDDIRRARTLNWDRKHPADMSPGMPLEERREVAAAARINGELGRIAALWHALEDLVSGGEKAAGRVRVELEVTRDLGQARVLHVAGLRPLAPWLPQLPILLLDGTGDLDRVRRLLPDAEVLQVPQVAAPHARVHLVTGAFGASAMTSAKKQTDLLAFMTARVAPSVAALLVTHKAATDGFTAAGFDLALAHHGAIAGRDGHRAIRHQFITAGRSLPPEAAAELAAAVTGEAVSVAERIRLSAPVKLRNGSTVMVERMAYADPRTQKAHDDVLFADIGQAVGRGRGILRTTATPLDTWIFANAAPPGMVFDTVQTWDDVRPDCIDRAMQAGAVPRSPTHAALLHPNFFPTVKAAEAQIARAVTRTRRQFNLPATMSVSAVIRWRVERQAATWGQHWAAATYQRLGQGHAPTEIYAPTKAMPLIRKIVVGTLGPVTWGKSTGEVVPAAPLTSNMRARVTSRPEIASVATPRGGVRSQSDFSCGSPHSFFRPVSNCENAEIHPGWQQ